MFNIDGRLWEFLNKMTDLIILNLMFVVCSLPIITIGAAKAALYEGVERISKNEGNSIIKFYLKCFMGKFKGSTVMWIAYFGVMILVCLNVYAIVNIGLGWLGALFMSATFIVFFCINAMFFYAIYYYACFESSVIKSLQAGILFTVTKLPFTAMILLVEFLPVLIIFFQTHFFMYVLTLYFVIGFSASALFNYHVFDKVTF